VSYVYPYVLTPADVWNHPTRALTHYFAVFERGRGYTASPAVVVRERRAIRPNTKFVIVSSTPFGIFLFSEDLAKSATKSILVTWTISGSGAELDGNDDTYMQITVPASTSRTPAVKYDLGSVKSQVVLFIVYQASSSVINLYVSVSSDDVTYTDVLTTNTTIKTTFVVVASNVRYVRLDFDNSVTVSAYGRVFTLEVYDKGIGSERLFTSLVEDLLTIVVDKYYQVLEVIQL